MSSDRKTSSSLRPHPFLDGMIQSMISRQGLDSIHVMVVASTLPALMVILWHYAQTVIEIRGEEQSQWILHWLLQRQTETRPTIWQRWRSCWSNKKATTKIDFTSMSKKNSGSSPKSHPLLPTTTIRDYPRTTWTSYGRWWTPVLVQREQQASSNDKTTTTPIDVVSSTILTVWFAPFNGRKIVERILLDGRQLWLDHCRTHTEVWQVVVGDDGSPSFQVTARPTQSLSSVIVDPRTKDFLLQQCVHFLQSEEWYLQKNLPYRRGFLLYGPAGCGKKSLVMALAGELHFPVCLIPAVSKTTATLVQKLVSQQAPRDCILLFTDWDRIDNDNTTIDAMVGLTGRLVYMTSTTAPKDLPSSMVRAGEVVDIQCSLGRPTKSDARQLFDQFFEPSKSQDLEKFKSLMDLRSAFLDKLPDGVHSFATLQGIFILARDHPQRIVEEIDRLAASNQQ